MTRLTGSALRVTVYIGENDTWHHKPLYTEIVHRAHAAGLAGASVFRGIEGFGASSLIHTTRLLSLSEDLPVAVVIVDTETRVRDFLPQLGELVTEGLVILDECEVIRYVGRDGPRDRPQDGLQDRPHDRTEDRPQDGTQFGIQGKAGTKGKKSL